MTWYAEKARPSAPSKIYQLIPEDDNGRKPNYRMIQKWVAELDWHQRADEMDAKAMVIVEDTLVNQKAEMLKRQAIDAFILAGKAREFLLSGTPDSYAAAVNLYFKSTEEERTTRGLGDFIVKVSKMTNEEIQKKITDYSNRASNSGQLDGVLVIDAEDIEDKKENNSEEDDMTD